MKKSFLAVFAVIVIFTLDTCASTGQQAAGLVSQDEALAGAAADFGSRVQGRTEIAIVEINTGEQGVSDFLCEELALHLSNSAIHTVGAKRISFIGT